MNIIKELTKDLKPTPARPPIFYQWFYTIIILSIIGAIYTFILGLYFDRNSKIIFNTSRTSKEI